MSVFTENYFANCETEAEAKARWRELSKKYHPDKFAVNKITDPAQKKEYEEKMYEINMQYQWQIAYIEEQEHPHGDDEEKTGLIFRATMKIIRRYFCHGLNKQYKDFKFDRQLCRFMSFYIFDYNKSCETGVMHTTFDIKPELVQFLIDVDAAKVNKNNMVIIKMPLDAGDIKTLKGYIPKMRKHTDMEIPDEAQNIALLGDFINWTITIVISRPGKDQLSRTFPERKKKLLQKPNEQLN